MEAEEAITYMARARSVFLSANCLVGVDQQNPEMYYSLVWCVGAGAVEANNHYPAFVILRKKSENFDFMTFYLPFN